MAGPDSDSDVPMVTFVLYTHAMRSLGSTLGSSPSPSGIATSPRDEPNTIPFSWPLVPIVPPVMVTVVLPPVVSGFNPVGIPVSPSYVKSPTEPYAPPP